MSEKRFTYDKPPVAFSKGGINDNITGETYEFTMDTVLDLLNELNEENEQLKELIDILDDIDENACKYERSMHKKILDFFNFIIKEYDIDPQKIIDWRNG